MGTVEARHVETGVTGNDVPNLSELFVPCPRKGCHGTTVLNYAGDVAYCNSCLQAWDRDTREPIKIPVELYNQLACEDRLYGTE